MQGTFRSFLKPKQFKQPFNLFTLSKKNAFLRPTKPLSNTQDVDELPSKDTDIGMRLDSKRTFTKWFNPNTFDPRTPDYYETVRGDWREDVTHEDFGEVLQTYYYTMPIDHLFPGMWMLSYWMNEPEVII